MELMATFLEETNLFFTNDRKSWEKLTKILNESGAGPKKTIEKWKKTLGEIKQNLKKKVRQTFVTAQENTLTDLEERFLSFMQIKEVPLSQLGWDDEDSNSGIVSN